MRFTEIDEDDFAQSAMSNENFHDVCVQYEITLEEGQEICGRKYGHEFEKQDFSDEISYVNFGSFCIYCGKRFEPSDD